MEGDANEIQQQIEQRIGELPPDVQNAILSADFNEKIGAISTAAQLHIDQAQQFSDNTMLVMLGFMNESEYRKETVDLVGGNTALAEKIISEANSQIFLPIRESMKNFTAQESEAPVSAPAAVNTPAVTSVVIPPKAEMHPADLILTQKTVAIPPLTTKKTIPSTSTAPVASKPAQDTPPKPQDYKADPYREPTI